MKLKELREAAFAEAAKLHEIATDDEKNNLTASLVDPSSPKLCIYGQMTGSCEGARAKELMGQACSKVVSNPRDDIPAAIYARSEFESCDILFGDDDYHWQVDEDSNYHFRRYDYFSPIEALIFNSRAAIKDIVRIIKTGKR